MLIAVSPYLTNTISLPEVIWTVFTGFGLFLNIRLLKMAKDNLKSLRQLGINSLREFAAVTSLISESLRVLVQFIFFMVGAVAMMIPASTSTNPPAFQWVLSFALCVTAVILVIASWVDKQRRESLVYKILKLEDMGNG